ncbi:hypothetical protein NNC19_19155 [Clostridium sp. SHJSY1]|uniref:hypothetical protein n=1 Tax=Clostridium sp. SHJSY1 TaxID=2942483 RepID=UPI002874FDE3|nr:hypothetical protein [Clostridium sp. SHJSY1]MDS0527814.1 hypothetical protein [Clostridium sp. SHJSY1]
MKSKMLIALAILGVLSIGGTKIFAQTSKNTIKRNVLMTEKTEVTKSEDSNDEVMKDSNNEISRGSNGKITKERAVEIMEEALSRYFDIKEKSKKLNLDISPSRDSENNLVQWIISWNSEKTNVSYCGIVDVLTGKIEFIKENGDKSNPVQEMSVQEMKELSIKFVKKYKLIDNVDNLKLLGEYCYEQMDKEKQYVFTYGEKDTDVIYINIDLVNKKVCGFAGGSLDLAHIKKVSE